MQNSPDAFSLLRFLEAQQPVYARVIEELKAGRKQSHWMWFIFPQIAGLGHSALARHYAIALLDEAGHYLAHPVLGTRLIECTRLVLAVRERTAREILGTPDDLRFRSCMALFRLAAPEREEFPMALDRFFDGELDARTAEILRGLLSKVGKKLR